VKLTRINCIPALGLLFCVACRQDMHDQPRFQPLQASAFFADGRSARPIPTGSVSRGSLDQTDTVHTGSVDGEFSAEIPISVTNEFLQRGQERFDIYCAPCHGYIGDGDGMVARRGFRAPSNLHTDRVRMSPPGYLFQVISNGFGGMPEYAGQVPPRDRWAIVAYVRALELSQNAKINDVPLNLRSNLEMGNNAP
jgi:hypothetical protein